MTTSERGRGRALLLCCPEFSLPDVFPTHLKFAVQHSNMNSTGSQSSAAGRRVCMLVYSFYESDNRVMRYARALVERGDEVDVIALSSGDDQPALKCWTRSTSIAFSAATGTKRASSPTSTGCSSFASNPRSASAASSSSAGMTSSTSTMSRIFWCSARCCPKLTGAKIILDIHDILPEFFANKFRRSEEQLLRQPAPVDRYVSAGFADHVIISNHLWRDKITLRSVPADKCSVFINHVDTTVFNCARTRNDGRFIMILSRRPATTSGPRSRHQCVCPHPRTGARRQNSIFTAAAT